MGGDAAAVDEAFHLPADHIDGTGTGAAKGQTEGLGPVVSLARTHGGHTAQGQGPHGGRRRGSDHDGIGRIDDHVLGKCPDGAVADVDGHRSPQGRTGAGLVAAVAHRHAQHSGGGHDQGVVPGCDFHSPAVAGGDGATAGEGFHGLGHHVDSARTRNGQGTAEAFVGLCAGADAAEGHGPYGAAGFGGDRDTATGTRTRAGIQGGIGAVGPNRLAGHIDGEGAAHGTGSRPGFACGHTDACHDGIGDDPAVIGGLNDDIAVGGGDVAAAVHIGRNGFVEDIDRAGRAAREREARLFVPAGAGAVAPHGQGEDMGIGTGRDDHRARQVTACRTACKDVRTGDMRVHVGVDDVDRHCGPQGHRCGLVIAARSTDPHAAGKGHDIGVVDGRYRQIAAGGGHRPAHAGLVGDRRLQSGGDDVYRSGARAGDGSAALALVRPGPGQTAGQPHDHRIRGGLNRDVPAGIDGGTGDHGPHGVVHHAHHRRRADGSGDVVPLFGFLVVGAHGGRHAEGPCQGADHAVVVGGHPDAAVRRHGRDDVGVAGGNQCLGVAVNDIDGRGSRNTEPLVVA